MLAATARAYRGWLPNARAPEVFARHLATVHVPRRFYVTMLPGIPTIRVFEALACGIPLVSAPWRTARTCSARRGLLVAARRRGDDAAPLKALRTTRTCAPPLSPRARDDPRPPQLRPPDAELLAILASGPQHADGGCRT
jgi:hypothetical protein